MQVTNSHILHQPGPDCLHIADSKAKAQLYTFEVPLLAFSAFESEYLYLWLFTSTGVTLLKDGRQVVEKQFKLAAVEQTLFYEAGKYLVLLFCTETTFYRLTYNKEK